MELTEVPYFLRSTPSSATRYSSSPEMWFAVPGAGAKAHADGHCEATISLQLSGRKRWRVGSMHNFREWGQNKLYAEVGDGEFDPAVWGASHETILSPGEAIVFP